MRIILVSTLSHVLELGIFAAAAVALVLGMMNLR